MLGQKVIEVYLYLSFKTERVIKDSQSPVLGRHQSPTEKINSMPRQWDLFFPTGEEWGDRMVSCQRSRTLGSGHHGQGMPMWADTSWTDDTEIPPSLRL